MLIQSLDDFMRVRTVATTAKQFQALSAFCREQAT